MTSNWRVQAGALFAAFMAIAPESLAEGIETRGGYCNDSYFSSDGGGISACLEYAVHWDANTIGIGLFGATPELRSNLKGNDPLEEIARINAWYGREFESDRFHYAITGRAGIEGGAADDLAISLKEALHDLFGEGNAKLGSTHPTTFIGGVSGWGRGDFGLSEGTWNASVTPYVHAALGNDVIEGGGGVMLSLQPSEETEGLALVLPKNGAYAPTFGGNGIGVFVAVRGVARETLYDDLANPLIAEAGIMAQVTVWDFAVAGISASCTTKPYDGSDREDCKATLQLGGLF
jgi:hypothetical protein